MLKWEKIQTMLWKKSVIAVLTEIKQVDINMKTYQIVCVLFAKCFHSLK